MSEDPKAERNFYILKTWEEIEGLVFEYGIIDPRIREATIHLLVGFIEFSLKLILDEPEEGPLPK